MFRRGLPLPERTLPSMNSTRNDIAHTGSVVAQDKKARVSAERSQAVSKNKLDSDTHTKNIAIGAKLKIMSLNIEGISMQKCDYLSRLLNELDIDILLLQETHLELDSAPSRSFIAGYTEVSKQCHPKYGISTYARKPELVAKLGETTENNGTQRCTVKTEGIEITNVYKPPAEKWSQPPKRQFEHPALIIGDFNSHHNEWGYKEANAAGHELHDWAIRIDAHLIYDPNTRGTFRSARWNKDYTPDLVFVTKDANHKPLAASREVLTDFPNSQHRPIIITTGIQIIRTEAIPQPRWNFKKANWEEYTSHIERTCQRIPPSSENITRFGKLILKSAKKSIPRGVRKWYIPCWSEASENLLKEFEKTQDQEIAEQLLSTLQEDRRKRWIETVENLDMRHSSRHAWQLIKKLEPKDNVNKTAPVISADEVAKEIKQRGRHIPDHVFERKIRKEYNRIWNSLPKDGSMWTLPISYTEIDTAIKDMKNGKAAGIDGIYPDMITHLGPAAKQWLASAMTDILEKGKYPQTWKHAKVIAILKPGKPATSPSSYRPISLLCCLYKLLEKIILTRITPMISNIIPVEQAGFQQNRCTTEQVLALTSQIEAGFERKQKTGTVLLDLSAAYDTVWTGGLMLKLARVIHCRKLLKLIAQMTGPRKFHVVLGSTYSKVKRIKNGVPQGSVLAPALFNVYISDMPDTTSLKLGYADDWALTHQSRSWNEIESTLSKDVSIMKRFFDTWYLKMNTTKTVTTAFHLNNKESKRTLKIEIDGETLPADQYPKYLGVTLDRQLTYKKHLEGTASKIGKRNCLLRKLAGTTWGASQTLLRTSTLALCHSVGEYCAPVWMRSTHTNLVDVKLRESMRIITGCLKSTPTQWLPVMSAIAPPHLRRENINQKWVQTAESATRTPLQNIYKNAPRKSRLKSRSPFYLSKKENYNINEAWRNEWENKRPTGGEIIRDPCEPLPGLRTQKRKYWTAANRLRSRHTRLAANMHRWGMKESPMCPRCTTNPQDTDHLVLRCPETRLTGGYETVHKGDETLQNWIDEFNLEV